MRYQQLLQHRCCLASGLPTPMTPRPSLTFPQSTQHNTSAKARPAHLLQPQSIHRLPLPLVRLSTLYYLQTSPRPDTVAFLPTRNTLHLEHCPLFDRSGSRAALTASLATPSTEENTQAQDSSIPHVHASSHHLHRPAASADFDCPHNFTSLRVRAYPRNELITCETQFPSQDTVVMQ